MTCRKCKKQIPTDSLFCLYCGAKQAVSTEHKTKVRGNGTGSAYKLPDGKWRAAVTLGYDENQKRIYKTKSGFKTKKEALEYLPTLRGEAEKPKEKKFSTLYDEWNTIHYPTISKGKQTHYKIAYSKCRDIHYRNISDIRAKDIQSAVDADGGGYYPKHDIKVLCNLIFKYAMQNDYVVKNCAQFVRLPPVPKSTRDAFNREEIASIWTDYEAGNEFTGYILILIYTGMRLGELQVLCKENIHLDRGYMIGGIKTEAGIDREIAISDKIRPIIEKFMEQTVIKLLEMDEKAFYRNYYAALERAGSRRMTPHCCRHTFMTLMVEAGAQAEITKALAGHTDYQTTLQYTHVSLAEKLKTVNKI